MNNSSKPNDFVAVSLNTEGLMTDDQLKAYDITPENTSIQSEDYYKNIKQVQDSFRKDDGTFDDETFHNWYQSTLRTYNNFATSNYEAGLLKRMATSPYDTFSLGDTNIQNTDARIFSLHDPERHSSGMGNVRELGSATFDVREVAQNNWVRDENGNILDWKPNDKGGLAKALTRPTLVLATYDEDEKDANGRIIHHKGDMKFDENGDPYYELLGNRDASGRDVLHYTDTITRDDDDINRFDFFDSDSLDKSLVGTVAKTAFSLTPYLIPGVAPVMGYIGATMALGKALPTIGQALDGIITGSDSDDAFGRSLGKASAWLSRFDPSTSREAQNKFISWEGVGQMVADSAAQLFQQRSLINGMQNILKKMDVKDADKVASKLALGYMAATSTTDTYDTFKEAGVNDRVAGLGMLATMSGIYALMDNDYFFKDSMFKNTWLDEDQELRKTMKSINEYYAAQAKSAIDEGVDINSLNLFQKMRYKITEALSKNAKKNIDKLAKMDVLDLAVKETPWWQQILSKSINEGTEEVMEESVTDMTKCLIKGLESLGVNVANENVDDVDFGLTWQEMLGRYATSAIGGAIGGATFGAFDYAGAVKQSKLNKDDWNKNTVSRLIYFLQTDKKQDILDNIASEEKKGHYGSTALSGTSVEQEVAENGTVKTPSEKLIYNAGTDSDNQNIKVANTVRGVIESIDSWIKDPNVVDFMGRSANWIRIAIDNDLEEKAEKAGITKEAYIEKFHIDPRLQELRVAGFLKDAQQDLTKNTANWATLNANYKNAEYKYVTEKLNKDSDADRVAIKEEFAKTLQAKQLKKEMKKYEDANKAIMNGSRADYYIARQRFTANHNLYGAYMTYDITKQKDGEAPNAKEFSGISSAKDYALLTDDIQDWEKLTDAEKKYYQDRWNAYITPNETGESAYTQQLRKAFDLHYNQKVQLNEDLLKVEDDLKGFTPGLNSQTRLNITQIAMMDTINDLQESLGLTDDPIIEKAKKDLESEDKDAFDNAWNTLQSFISSNHGIELYLQKIGDMLSSGKFVNSNLLGDNQVDFYLSTVGATLSYLINSPVSEESGPSSKYRRMDNNQALAEALISSFTNTPFTPEVKARLGAILNNAAKTYGEQVAANLGRLDNDPLIPVYRALAPGASNINEVINYYASKPIEESYPVYQFLARLCINYDEFGIDQFEDWKLASRISDFEGAVESNLIDYFDEDDVDPDLFHNFWGDSLGFINAHPEVQDALADMVRNANKIVKYKQASDKIPNLCNAIADTLSRGNYAGVDINGLIKNLNEVLTLIKGTPAETMLMDEIAGFDGLFDVLNTLKATEEATKINPVYDLLGNISVAQSDGSKTAVKIVKDAIKDYTDMDASERHKYKASKPVYDSLVKVSRMLAMLESVLEGAVNGDNEVFNSYRRINNLEEFATISENTRQILVDGINEIKNTINTLLHISDNNADQTIKEQKAIYINMLPKLHNEVRRILITTGLEDFDVDEYWRKACVDAGVTDTAVTEENLGKYQKAITLFNKAVYDKITEEKENKTAAIISVLKNIAENTSGLLSTSPGFFDGNSDTKVTPITAFLWLAATLGANPLETESIYDKMAHDPDMQAISPFFSQEPGIKMAYVFSVNQELRDGVLKILSDLRQDDWNKKEEALKKEGKSEEEIKTARTDYEQIFGIETSQIFHLDGGAGVGKTEMLRMIKKMLELKYGANNVAFINSALDLKHLEDDLIPRFNGEGKAATENFGGADKKTATVKSIIGYFFNDNDVNLENPESYLVIEEDTNGQFDINLDPKIEAKLKEVLKDEANSKAKTFLTDLFGENADKKAKVIALDEDLLIDKGLKKMLDIIASHYGISVIGTGDSTQNGSKTILPLKERPSVTDTSSTALTLSAPMIQVSMRAKFIGQSENQKSLYRVITKMRKAGESFVTVDERSAESSKVLSKMDASTTPILIGHKSTTDSQIFGTIAITGSEFDGYVNRLKTACSELKAKDSKPHDLLIVVDSSEKVDIATKYGDFARVVTPSEVQGSQADFVIVSNTVTQTLNTGTGTADIDAYKALYTLLTRAKQGVALTGGASLVKNFRITFEQDAAAANSLSENSEFEADLKVYKEWRDKIFDEARIPYNDVEVPEAKPEKLDEDEKDPDAADIEASNEILAKIPEKAKKEELAPIVDGKSMDEIEDEAKKDVEKLVETIKENASENEQLLDPEALVDALKGSVFSKDWVQNEEDLPKLMSIIQAIAFHPLDKDDVADNLVAVSDKVKGLVKADKQPYIQNLLNSLAGKGGSKRMFYVKTDSELKRNILYFIYDLNDEAKTKFAIPITFAGSDVTDGAHYFDLNFVEHIAEDEVENGSVKIVNGYVSSKGQVIKPLKETTDISPSELFILAPDLDSISNVNFGDKESSYLYRNKGKLFVIKSKNPLVSPKRYLAQPKTDDTGRIVSFYDQSKVKAFDVQRRLRFVEDFVPGLSAIQINKRGAQSKDSGNELSNARKIIKAIFGNNNEEASSYRLLNADTNAKLISSIIRWTNDPSCPPLYRQLIASNLWACISPSSISETRHHSAISLAFVDKGKYRQGSYFNNFVSVYKDKGSVQIVFPYGTSITLTGKKMEDILGNNLSKNEILNHILSISTDGLPHKLWKFIAETLQSEIASGLKIQPSDEEFVNEIIDNADDKAIDSKYKSGEVAITLNNVSFDGKDATVYRTTSTQVANLILCHKDRTIDLKGETPDQLFTKSTCTLDDWLKKDGLFKYDLFAEIKASNSDAYVKDAKSSLKLWRSMENHAKDNGFIDSLSSDIVAEAPKYYTIYATENQGNGELAQEYKDFVDTISGLSYNKNATNIQGKAELQMKESGELSLKSGEIYFSKPFLEGFGIKENIPEEGVYLSRVDTNAKNIEVVGVNGNTITISNPDLYKALSSYKNLNNTDLFDCVSFTIGNKKWYLNTVKGSISFDLKTWRKFDHIAESEFILDSGESLKLPDNIENIILRNPNKFFQVKPSPKNHSIWLGNIRIDLAKDNWFDPENLTVKDSNGAIYHIDPTDNESAWILLLYPDKEPETKIIGRDEIRIPKDVLAILGGYTDNNYELLTSEDVAKMKEDKIYDDFKAIMASGYKLILLEEDILDSKKLANYLGVNLEKDQKISKFVNDIVDKISILKKNNKDLSEKDLIAKAVEQYARDHSDYTIGIIEEDEKVQYLFIKSPEIISVYRKLLNENIKVNPADIRIDGNGWSLISDKTIHGVFDNGVPKFVQNVKPVEVKPVEAKPTEVKPVEVDVAPIIQSLAEAPNLNVAADIIMQNKDKLSKFNNLICMIDSDGEQVKLLDFLYSCATQPDGGDEKLNWKVYEKLGEWMDDGTLTDDEAITFGRILTDLATNTNGC